MSGDTLLEEKGRHLVVRIFAAVSQGEMKLAPEEGDKLVTLICSQITAFKSKSMWIQVHQWADLLLPYLSREQSQDLQYAGVAVSKIEALLKLQQNVEAMEFAFQTVSKTSTHHTILMYFQTLLAVDDITEEDMVHRLRYQQDKMEKKSTATSTIVEDKIDQIMACLSIANGSQLVKVTQRRQDGVTSYLIKYLLQLCLDEGLGKVDRTTLKVPILNLAKMFLGTFLSTHLKCTSSEKGICVEAETVEEAIKRDTFRLSSFRDQLLSIADVAVSLVEKGSTAYDHVRFLEIMGDEKILIEVADIVSSLGYFMTLATKQARSGMKKKEILLASASILEHSTGLYQLLPLFNDSTTKQSEARCMVTAASALLDAAALIAPEPKEFDEFISGRSFNDEHEGEFLAIHVRVRNFAERAQRALYNQLEFDDPTDVKLFSIATVMELSSFCRSGDIGHSEEFVAKILPHLSTLDIEYMKTCIDLFASSQNVSTESFRKLLSIAEAMCLQSTPVNSALGYVLSKELQLSPTRAAALRRVEQFAKLLENPLNAQAIPTEDVDYIAANAYNAAMSLHELGQGDLAVKFNSLAMGMIPFITKERRDEWMTRMKVRECAESLHGSVIECV